MELEYAIIGLVTLHDEGFAYKCTMDITMPTCGHTNYTVVWNAKEAKCGMLWFGASFSIRGIKPVYDERVEELDVILYRAIISRISGALMKMGVWRSARDDIFLLQSTCENSSTP
ncbi:hypothetical protein SRHO_G00124070 [Serrasalmus rhombeus]